MGNHTAKIAILLGTRPEIIRLAPVIRECIRQKRNFFVLHTNQHYSENLDKIFFKELGLSRPKYNLGVGSGSQARQTGRMLVGIEKILIKEKPDVVLVFGDPNTALAGALSAVKLNIKIGHIEAGLRSYDRTMPEEINRILADHCSDLLFAPTKTAKATLINEGISKSKIFVTGATTVDVLHQNMQLAQKTSKILKKLDLKKDGYFLLTFHRSENVGSKQRVSGMLKGLELVHKKHGLPIFFPIHPRTKNMIGKFKLTVPTGVRIMEPVGLLDFLQLQANARLILTDSGGIQEESCLLKIPCVTLRNNTERPETLEIKSNILSGTDPKRILQCVGTMLKSKKKWKNPFGEKGVAKRIVDICEYV
ncbi:MAG: UDP-N-acetylglucosamine 2-epimerase (non-hydrolyzing) [bacterium]|nr:UDP-N-acetylglucosamine 2-epimerase (non-hydrolyzing) [bacterium]